MTELEKAANDFFPIDEKTMSLDEQSDQLLRQIGFKFGAKWQYEQFEKERLKHCDELTAEQAQIESDFVVQHLKKYNRTPTFIDAIEYGKRLMIDRADKLEKLGQAMYDKMQNLTTDCTGIRAAMEKWWCYINKLNKED